MTRRSRITTQIIIALGVLFAVCESQPVFGGVHLSVEGYNSKGHAGLQVQTETFIDASVNVDVLSFMRLGFSYSKDYDVTKGYREIERGLFDRMEDTQEQISQSANMTLIPFAGQIVTPYVFGGVGQKTYHNTWWSELRDGDAGPQEIKIRPGERDYPRYVYNFGLGVSVNLNRSVSMTFKNVWSEGRRLAPGDTDYQKTLDSKFTYGVTYHL